MRINFKFTIFTVIARFAGTTGTVSFAVIFTFTVIFTRIVDCTVVSFFTKNASCLKRTIGLANAFSLITCHTVLTRVRFTKYVNPTKFTFIASVTIALLVITVSRIANHYASTFIPAVHALTALIAAKLAFFSIITVVTNAKNTICIIFGSILTIAGIFVASVYVRIIT